MSAQTSTQGSPWDTVKLFLAAAMLLAGVVGYYYFADQPLLYRVLGILGATALSAAFALTSAPGKAFLSFAKGARVELARVVWPTKRETWQATLLVIGMVFLVGVLLWMFDMVLVKGIRLITGQGG
jgi:preprotein translocase subunit SecE